MRKLTEKEIFLLEDQGCLADDWSKIDVTSDDFRPTNIYNVRFYGKVELGSMKGKIEVEEGFTMRCGIHNAVLRDVAVGDNCLIENVGGYISNYEIGSNVFISNIGVMSTRGLPNYANGTVLSVLNEAGDGNIVIYDKLTAQSAMLMMNHKPVFDMILNEQKHRSFPERGVIGSNSRIVGVKEMINVMVGEYSELQGASHISDCTIQSNQDSPTMIGPDVIMENSIVTYGATVTGGAKLDNTFVGESVHVGKGYSSESSVMFSNSYLDNGEACAAFLGPFSCSHHKGSLLIAGNFSFYNAGSSTNQSNHAYKMGPIHYGTLDRGGKTASGAHIIWPAHFGAFTMVMGKIESHPDITELPFSYVIGKENKTIVVPGVNIRTVGTWRDINKWPKRDMRSKNNRKDIINFAFPNPFIIQQVVKGKKLLTKLIESCNDEYIEYNNCTIRRTSAVRAIEYYDMAIGLFLYGIFNRTQNDEENNEVGADNWIDLAGMIVPEKEIERLVNDTVSGEIHSTSDLLLVLKQINEDYKDNEASYAKSLMQNESKNLFINTDEWLEKADKAYRMWMKLIKDDAEKEYQLGDVDEDFFREFIAKL